MSDSPLNLFGSRRRKKRRQAKLAAMTPAERAAYKVQQKNRLQGAMAGSLIGGAANIASMAGGVGNTGEDVQSQISEINSKLDTLTGGGGGAAGVANNVIQAPEPAEPASAIGDDVDVVDGDSALAKLRKYKGSCKMKKK